MGRRFAPIPYDAAELAKGDPFVLAAVLHLYQEGHRARWGWLETSQPDLVKRSGAKRSQIRKLLDDLVAAGLAVRETIQSGGRRDGTRLRLLDPVADEASTNDAPTTHQRAANEERDRQRVTDPPAPTTRQRTANDAPTYKVDDPVTPLTEVCVVEGAGATEREPDPPPPVITALVDDPEVLRSSGMSFGPELAALLEHTQQTMPSYAFEAADMRRIRAALGRFSVGDLALVWDHHQLAAETAHARQSGWASRWASLCTDRLPGRVRDARRWDEAGRPVESAPARASPGRPRRQSALEMLESIRERRSSEGPQVSDAAAWFAGGHDG